jgi:hypothetical protein
MIDKVTDNYDGSLYCPGTIESHNILGMKSNGALGAEIRHFMRVGKVLNNFGGDAGTPQFRKMAVTLQADLRFEK